MLSLDELREKTRPKASARLFDRTMPAAGSLAGDLAATLDGYRVGALANPLENPVQRLAFDLGGRLDRGELDRDDIRDLVQYLAAESFAYRAQRLRGYIGRIDPDANDAAMRALFEARTRDAEGNRVAFEAFRAIVERVVVGVVFTAHPTFGMAPALTTALGALAAGRDEDGQPLSDAARDALLAMAVTTRHGPPPGISLAVEETQAEVAIAHAQGALARVAGIVLDVAAEAWPDDWTKLTPRLVSLATWVGYDIDGRSDIGWTATLRARLASSARQVERYLAEVQKVIRAMADGGRLKDGPEAYLRLAESRLILAQQMFAEDQSVLASGEDIENVRKFNRRLADSRSSRLVDIADLMQPLTRAIDAATDPEDKAALARLRAAVANLGLATAQPHMRLNASQIVNAIRHRVGIDSEESLAANRRAFMRAIGERLDAARPDTVNFGSLLAEPSSARRLMMLIAQFVKYIDAANPVRFLIAESESPFILLAALYFARRFGIADHIDISPLFETPMALEHGHEIIDQVLESPHYRDYVMARGRLCIQTGFSDAGRYLGQVPACLAIERARIKLAGVLTRHGLTGVEIVIFDTHGESIGRGAHPASLEDRLDYTYPPHCRATFAEAGLTVRQEVSFQGGDGYVFFSHPVLAYATVARLLERAMAPCPPVDDAFYRDTDYSLDFFLRAKAANETLFENADYGRLLGTFGGNLLDPTGSRVTRRQHEGGARADVMHPTQLRAIPHNGTLQQLGYLANSVTGIGRAIAEDPDRFAEVLASSDRLRRCFALAARAHGVGSLDAFAAYAAIFDPVIWQRQSSAQTGLPRAEQMRRLAALLAETNRHNVLNRLLQWFMGDALALDDALRAAGMPVAADCRPAMELLHAVRIALIHEIFLLIPRIPRFSTQPDITIEDVVADLLRLDVAPSVEVLRQAFPAEIRSLEDTSFGEPATYSPDGDHGYAAEHRELFTPLLELHAMVRQVSAAIMYYLGAVG